MPAPSARNIDPGTSPTAPVAVKVKGGLEFQQVSLIEGDGATDDYDSGLVAVPTADTQLTAATVYVKTVRFFNRHQTAVRKVRLRNTAGIFRYEDLELQPKQAFEVTYGKANAMVGLHWSHDGGAGEVTGQITGFQ